MSQLLDKKTDEILLGHVSPTIPSLVDHIKARYLFVPVYVKQINKVNGVNIVQLSNDVSYFISERNQWEIYTP